jgi:two-component system response regulator GlrR
VTGDSTSTLDRIGAGRVAGFVLTVTGGPSAGASFRSTGGTCRLGSGSEATLQLRDRAVSRVHCEIVGGPNGVTVRDLGSKNGITLDGVPVAEATARHGSLLRLGSSAIRIELAGLVDRLAPSVDESFGTLVGRSLAMRRLFALLDRLADSEASVLILGESGTGKEEAGRSIHRASARRDGPYVVVDCGAIAPALIETELFGHVRGGFTSAESDRDGAFVAAGGGTILFDEIGELPLELQPRLLRALDSRQIRPVGASSYRAVDVRVLAATHRDLAAEVERGRFRQDLYYRLAVSTVVLPPLRERSEDLELLIPTLLAGLDVDRALADALIAPTSLALIKSAAWPGNVRQLRNYLTRCLAAGQVLSPFDDVGEEPVDPIPGDDDYRGGVRYVVEQYEQAFVARILEACGGNVSEAIRRSGIGRATMYRLINRHHRKPPR